MRSTDVGRANNRFTSIIIDAANNVSRHFRDIDTSRYQTIMGVRLGLAVERSRAAAMEVAEALQVIEDHMADAEAMDRLDGSYDARSSAAPVLPGEDYLAAYVQAMVDGAPGLPMPVVKKKSPKPISRKVEACIKRRSKK
jgi:hypothetical protein